MDMKELKKLWNFMEGYKGIYLLGMLCIILSQMVTVVSPLVIRTTIDSIIGNETINSNIIIDVVNYLGVKRTFKNNIWIAGGILILIAILRGFFLYFKNTLASKAAKILQKIRDLYMTIYKDSL